MTLDHVFMLIDPAGPEVDHLLALGLAETYRRQHPGQGTQNVCFCFDNLFLELLWVNDAAAVQSETIARTGLYERSRWRTDGTNPFGIAWRESPGAPTSGLPTWAFRPPYLPAGMHIEVATDGDDPRQPMMFRSPGTTPPIDWPAEKRGTLQHATGLGRVLSVALTMPARVTPGRALKTLAATGSMLKLRASAADRFALELQIERRDSTPPLVLRLPAESG